jgi:hypothetical protein
VCCYLCFHSFHVLSHQRDIKDAVDEWRFEQSDWEELTIIRDVLGPFKDATLKLECTNTPTAHLAGRVMLWVLYKA